MEGDIHKAWLQNAALSVSKGHMLHIVGSLYCSFLSPGNPILFLSITKSQRQFYSYLLSQRWRGLDVGPLFPLETQPSLWRMGFGSQRASLPQPMGTLPAFFPQNFSRNKREWASQSETTCGTGYLDLDQEVRPHPQFLLWQTH